MPSRFSTLLLALIALATAAAIVGWPLASLARDPPAGGAGSYLVATWPEPGLEMEKTTAPARDSLEATRAREGTRHP